MATFHGAMSILACKMILVELALPCLAGLASITESHPADLISRSQQRVVGCQETAKGNRWGCDCQGHFVFLSIQDGFEPEISKLQFETSYCIEHA